MRNIDIIIERAKQDGEVKIRLDKDITWELYNQVEAECRKQNLLCFMWKNVFTIKTKAGIAEVSL